MNYLLIYRIFFASFLLMVAPACTPILNVDVVRFHGDEAIPRETFKIVPLDTEALEGPEFRHFADQVEAQLIALGYEKDEESPNMTIKIDYAIEEAEIYFSYPLWSHAHYFGLGPGFGRFYGADIALGWRYPGRGYSAWGFYGYPYAVEVHNFPYSSRLPRYDRIFEMVMFDAQETAVFEGRVVSRGRSSDLAEVFPYLVKGMFTDFPGDSGKSARFSFNMEDGSLQP